MPSTIEILKRRGILKRAPEERAAMVRRATAKVCTLQTASVPLPAIPDNLKWVDVKPMQWSSPLAYAWLGSHYVLRIKRNPSGKYRDKHLISLHTFWDARDGHLQVNPEPIVSQWHLCHFTEDRQNLQHVFDK